MWLVERSDTVKKLAAIGATVKRRWHRGLRQRTKTFRNELAGREDAEDAVDRLNARLTQLDEAAQKHDAKLKRLERGERP